MAGKKRSVPIYDFLFLSIFLLLLHLLIVLREIISVTNVIRQPGMPLTTKMQAIHTVSSTKYLSQPAMMDSGIGKLEENKKNGGTGYRSKVFLVRDKVLVIIDRVSQIVTSRLFEHFAQVLIFSLRFSSFFEI